MNSQRKQLFVILSLIIILFIFFHYGTSLHLISNNNSLNESSKTRYKNSNYYSNESTTNLPITALITCTPEIKYTYHEVNQKPNDTQINFERNNYQISYEHLYKASLSFLADTPQKADEVANLINYLGECTESASNVCGPLSIAIMVKAGLLPKNTNIHNAWLLCARENKENCFGLETLKRDFFPPNDYDYIRIHQSVREYDFRSNPLQPGDWMYLYTHTHGYDHMIVVTRVDEKGTAFTVTNINRGDGFVISEEILYDLTDPCKGLFYELTDQSRRKLGMVGTEGFLLIRKKGGISTISDQPYFPTLGKYSNKLSYK